MATAAEGTFTNKTYSVIDNEQPYLKCPGIWHIGAAVVLFIFCCIDEMTWSVTFTILLVLSSPNWKDWRTNTPSCPKKFWSWTKDMFNSEVKPTPHPFPFHLMLNPPKPLWVKLSVAQNRAHLGKLKSCENYGCISEAPRAKNMKFLYSLFSKQMNSEKGFVLFISSFFGSAWTS